MPSLETNASRLLYLVQVSRPIIWPVLPLVYALGVHAAGAAWDATTIAQLVTLTFPMNLIGCGLNDIYDHESDRRSARRRAVWGAVVSEHERAFVLQACAAMIPIVILAACLTRNKDNFVATVSLVVIAWTYSVPPYRLKERPPLDSLANGLGYFLFPLIMGYSLNLDPNLMPVRYYLLALCVAGIHALATAADYDADSAAGHRTFAVVFGRRTAAVFAGAAFLGTWYYGDFQSAAVRVYLLVCAAATLPSVVVPRTALVTAACILILVGFGVAGSCHLAGLR